MTARERIGDVHGRRPRRGVVRVVKDLELVLHDAGFSTWPPNSARIAERTLAVNSPSPRDSKRCQRAALMTGAGTDSLIAASTVQRPSPESETRPQYWARSGDLVSACGGQVDEPGADHRTVAPDLGDVVEIEVVGVVLGILDRRGLRVGGDRLAADVGVLEDAESFADGRHHAVLDAVVDHLHEVARAVWTTAQVALRRGVTGDGRASAGIASSPGAIDLKIGSRRVTMSSSPPIMRLKPRSSPQTPPLVPQST